MSHRGVRVFIVDDHPIVRQGYSQLIGLNGDMQVCGEAASIEEALQELKTAAADLVVVDITLKTGSGLELCKQIKARHPHVKMLVVSAHDESLFAERVLHAGASGYVNKEEATTELIGAIRTVLSGKVYLSQPMTRRMLNRAVGLNSEQEESPIKSFTDRELEVFELIGQGLTGRQIAARLHLSPKTIETYRESIKKKLKAKNSTELTRHAIRWVLQDS